MRQNPERILDLLECPECHQGSLTTIEGEDSSVIGLGCESCGAFFLYRDGILDLLTKEEQNSVLVQKALGKREAKLYDALLALGSFRRLFSTGSFEDEVKESLSHFDLRSKDTVLDIGCGTGNYTLEFAKRASEGVAIGLDLSLPMLKLCKMSAYKQGVENILLVRANAENLPFREKSLARIYHGCLHLLEDIDPSLKSAYHCLAPGGILQGMTFFAPKAVLWRKIQEILPKMIYSRPFDPAVFQEHVKEAGFIDFQCKVRRYGRFRAAKSTSEVPPKLNMDMKKMQVD